MQLIAISFDHQQAMGSTVTGRLIGSIIIIPSP